MGFLDRFKDQEKEKKKKTNINVADLKPSLPAIPTQKQKIQAQKAAALELEQSETKKADEIARCSKLLRQMYTLDLRIWGMKHAVGEEAKQAEELKQRSNALFAEVQRVVSKWTVTPEDGWTAEELDQIQRIYEILGMHNNARYEV